MHGFLWDELSFLYRGGCYLFFLSSLELVGVWWECVCVSFSS